jgi:hypothetical protein
MKVVDWVDQRPRNQDPHAALFRPEMHAFVPAALRPIIDGAMSIVAAADRAGQNVVAELRFRRRGLLVLLGAILLLVVALALKIRQIDSRDHGRRLKEH